MSLCIRAIWSIPVFLFLVPLACGGSGAAGDGDEDGAGDGGTTGDGDSAGDGDSGGADGGSGNEYNCNHAEVVSDGLPSTCPAGQIAEVAGGSYGSCVALRECACETATQCGDGLSYACYVDGYCGDLVN